MGLVEGVYSMLSDESPIGPHFMRPSPFDRAAAMSADSLYSADTSRKKAGQNWGSFAAFFDVFSLGNFGSSWYIGMVLRTTQEKQ